MSQNYIDSEHYRQMLVKDGERRYREWHTRLIQHQRKFTHSERYRQMLVKDGERRYREWHTAFLRYQQKFLQEMAQTRQR